MDKIWMVIIISVIVLVYVHILFPVLVHQCVRQIAYAWTMGLDEAEKEIEETETQCGSRE